jgi:uncharacterized protein with HEPN domain
MDNRIEKWLTDIRLAGEEINFFVGQHAASFDDFRGNPLLKRAVERNLEIIGEAVNRVIKADKAYEMRIQHAKSIVGLRNQIIHGYDSISDENLWSILLSHLPVLLSDVNKLLHEK